MDIQLKNITKKYDNNLVLDDFNLSIEKNEMIAIYGSSGKGKTTLLNIIGLLEKPDSGDIFIQGFKNPRLDGRKTTLLHRNIIGYLFQNYALIDNHTVDKNLDIALQYNNNCKKQKEILKETALDRVGLGDKLQKKIFELNSGEQQRIALARLILKSCNIILTDEPTGLLDLENSNHVLKILKSLNNEGKTVVIATHNFEVADSCNRVVKL